MAEKYLVLEQLKIEYNGIFSVQELYQIIDKYFREKGYDKRELRHHEHVTENGKYIEIELMPWKKISDYVKNEIRIYITIYNLKDVIIEQKGKKIPMQRGELNVVVDAFLNTDYENRWETTPFYYFLRVVFDKYIYKGYIDGFEEKLKEDTSGLISTLKSYLNLYKYKFE